MADQASALAQADTAFRAQAVAAGATLIAASGCYLTVEPSGNVSGGVCGPVGYATDPADAHWQTFTVAPPSKPGGLVLRPGQTGQRLTPGARLVRPGKPDLVVRAPSETGAPIAAGQVVTLDEPGLTLTPVVGATLGGYSSRATISALAQAYAAGPAGHRVVTPLGRRLVVATVEVDHATLPPTGEPSDGPDLAFTVDGQTVSVGNMLAFFGAARTYAVSVPDDVTAQASVALTEEGASDDLSLLTGQRATTSPAIFHRSDSNFLSAGQNATATLTVTDATGIATTHQVSLAEAALSWFSPERSPRHPTDPGHSFLVVDVEAADGLSGIYPGATPQPDAIHLELGDGTRVAAQQGTSDSYHASFANELYFEVPANLATATLVIGPGGLTSDTTHRIASAASLPITFPAPPPPTASVVKAAPAPAGVLTEQLAVLAPPNTVHAARPASRALPIGAAIAALVIALIAVTRRRHRAPEQTAPVDERAPYPDWPAPARDDHQDTSAASVPPAATEPFTPPMPPDLGDGLVLHFIGPLDITGTNAKPDPLQAANIAYFAMLDDRDRSADEARSDLRPPDSEGGGREISIESFRTYASTIRGLVGAEHFPLASRSVGYQLVGFTSDWATFQELVKQAREASTTEQAIELLGAALALVRGEPLEGAEPEFYAWWYRRPGLRTNIVVPIAEAAHRLATLALATDQVRLAAWAIDLGRTGLPGDHDLLGDRLRVAAHIGGPRELQQAWDDTMAELGKTEAQRTLGGLHQELKGGFTAEPGG